MEEDVIATCLLKHDGMTVHLVPGLPDYLILRMAASIIIQTKASGDSDVRELLVKLGHIVQRTHSQAMVH